MGKFRVKPARSVAKPFKKSQQKIGEGSFAKISTTRVDPEFIQVPAISLTSTSKISKRPKSRTSALKKKSTAATASESESPPSPKKSVTFASPSSNTVHVFGRDKNKKDSVRDILKGGAGALVNLVSGGISNLKRKGLPKPGINGRDSYNIPKIEATSSNSLNKVLRNQFKDKRTRRKLRTDAFHKKLSLMKASENETKAEKRRKATVIVGDMQPIAKILAELEEEVKAAEVAKPVIMPPKKKRLTLKKREQEMLDALKFFEAAGV